MQRGPPSCWDEANVRASSAVERATNEQGKIGRSSADFSSERLRHRVLDASRRDRHRPSHDSANGGGNARCRAGRLVIGRGFQHLDGRARRREQRLHDPRRGESRPRWRRSMGHHHALRMQPTVHRRSSGETAHEVRVCRCRSSMSTADPIIREDVDFSALFRRSLDSMSNPSVRDQRAS